MSDTKYCPKCSTTKNIEVFNKNKARDDGLCTYCKTCESEYKKNYYLLKPEKWDIKKSNSRAYGARPEIKTKVAKIRRWRREEIDKLKTTGCTICGYNKCVWALDFHHIDPTTKKFRIANALSELKDLNKIKEEITKCELICANCHRELHWNERKYK